MKKSFFLLFLIGVGLFILNNKLVAFATSGACSYHGGVNCSSGPGVTGNVICNDGWTNSSVPFYETTECKVQITTCVRRFVTGCTIQSQLESLQNELDRNKRSCSAMHALMGLTGSSADNCSDSLLENKIAVCKAELQDYQIAEQDYQTCTQQKYAIYETQYDAYLKKIQESKDLQKSVDNYVNKTLVCRQSHGSQSMFNAVNNECTCFNSVKDSSNPFLCVFPETVLSEIPTVITAPANTNTTLTPQIKSHLDILTETFQLSRDLSIGSLGNDVINVQTFLEAKGFLMMPERLNKGYFGSLTKKALTAFQKSVNLPITGYLGALTRAKINGNQ